ncbi:MAG: hypothetical protein ACREJ2_07700 [Planctomycetota bacterium]
MRLATLAFSVVLFCAPLAAVATDAGSLGPDVHSGAPAPAPSAPTGAVGRTDLPTQPLTLYRQPRFGIIRLTTAGRESNEVGAPTWRWPDPSLTMPAPDDLLGGHADAWRAVQAALAGSSAHPPAGDPPTPAPTPAVSLQK